MVVAERFYLGTHREYWLDRLDVPLFVSHRTLGRRTRLPRAQGPWALDSGGFTELSAYGGWRTPPEAYVAAVRRYRDEIGNLVWASPQDWMCEPVMLARTGLTVEVHQQLTVENYLTLLELDATLPFVPVLQGWQPDDYLRHIDRYAAAGIDLWALPHIGVGTVCRRQDTDQGEKIMSQLAGQGLAIHGFGVKIGGLKRYGDSMFSADSMAWSYWARRDAARRRRFGGPTPPCGKNTCANCEHYALDWREKALAAISVGVPA